MYSDRRKSRAPYFIALALLLLVALGAYALAGGIMNGDMEEESAASLKAAVERGALQCFVVEGVYPPNLKYLEEHYGLQINHEDYYVTYDAFASNIPPEIRVTVREH